MRHLPVLALITLLLGCSATRGGPERRDYRLSPDLLVRPLAEGVWLHTWWMEAPGWGRFSSNGLIVASDGEALLVDTPVSDELTELLLRWAADSLGAPIRRAIVTHAHNDRMGGMAALDRADVVSYALPRTADRAVAQGWPRPDSLLSDEQPVRIGSRSVLAHFPGAGHTPDNLVVWLAEERLLYGGCFVKEADAGSIGNLGDAVVAEWPASVERVMERFPDAEVVVPGHGRVGGPRALERTLELLRELPPEAGARAGS